MSKVCQITGKKPMSGHHVSHANNKRKRRFMPNIQTHRYWIPSEKRSVKLRLSAKALRIIDKLGIEEYLKQQEEK